jgi:hypothetical protein
LSHHVRAAVQSVSWANGLGQHLTASVPHAQAFAAGETFELNLIFVSRSREGLLSLDAVDEEGSAL